MRKKKMEKINPLSKTEQLLMEKQGKQWIGQASITIILIVTGQEDD